MNTVVMLAAALSASGGATVPVVVPLPVVVPEQPKRDYTACLKAIESGKRVFLAVGVEPEDGDYFIKELKWGDGTAVEPGRYECELYEGKPAWRPVRKAVQVIRSAVPSVQFTGPFGGTVQFGGS